jgi:hypothetical protein
VQLHVEGIPMIPVDLMHAVDHPDEYVLEWRGGELHI